MPPKKFSFKEIPLSFKEGAPEPPPPGKFSFKTGRLSFKDVSPLLAPSTPPPPELPDWPSPRPPKFDFVPRAPPPPPPSPPPLPEFDVQSFSEAEIAPLTARHFKKTGVFFTVNLNSRDQANEAALEAAMHDVVSGNKGGEVFRRNWAGKGSDHAGEGPLMIDRAHRPRGTFSTEIGPTTGFVHAHGMIEVKYPREIGGKPQNLHIDIPRLRQILNGRYHQHGGQGDIAYVNVKVQGLDASTGYIYIHKDGRRVKVQATPENLRIWREQQTGTWRKK